MINFILYTMNKQLEQIEEGTFFDEYVIENRLTSIYISRWSAYAKLINRQWGVFLLDALFAPGEGNPMLTMAIYEAVRSWWRILELQAEVTHMKWISQEKLELFYSQFWFVKYGNRTIGWGILMRKDITAIPLISPKTLEKILYTSTMPQT